jgi:ribosomal protein L28
MAVCLMCDKKPVRTVWSRHKKGSSGHGGAWNLKAPISKKTQFPNLHTYKGDKYCTKCLRLVKSLTHHHSTPTATA